MILKRLKEETREQHEGLEQTVNVMDRMFTLEDYKALLLKFYRFYAPVEEVLAGMDFGATGYDFEGRRKVPQLKEDLAFLGILEVAENQLPAWEGFTAPENTAEAFGVLYVLEGATLGGQIINRHLKEHLGIEPGKGSSFFNGYGAMTGPMWKQFGETVTAYAEENGGEDEMVGAAKRTFDEFAECFTEPAAASLSAA